MHTQTVYSFNQKGKLRTWTYTVVKNSDSADLIITYGEKQGKQITSVKKFKIGKNIGKKNETTPFEQAISEGESKLQKKIDQGYSIDINTVSNTFKPMLALSYKDRSHDIIYPAFVQPKLDGVRTFVYPNQCTFYSRMGKQFYFLEPLLKNFLKKPVGNNIIFDCELYSDKLQFEEIVSTVKQQLKSPNKDFLQKLQLNCFDCYDTLCPNLSFEERYNLLLEYIYPEYIVKTYLIETENKMYNCFKNFVKSGHEGIIIRNRKGIYKPGKRSADLQKYKEFTDSEFKIVDYTESTGKSKGQIVFICITEFGNTFNVRPKGTDDYRKKLFKNGKQLIGKMLTVQYQGLTVEKIPRFPVGIAIRDYE